MADKDADLTGRNVLMGRDVLTGRDVSTGWDVSTGRDVPTGEHKRGSQAHRPREKILDR
jgi:hypothetical protein